MQVYKIVLGLFMILILILPVFSADQALESEEDTDQDRDLNVFEIIIKIIKKIIGPIIRPFQPKEENEQRIYLKDPYTGSKISDTTIDIGGLPVFVPGEIIVKFKTTIQVSKSQDRVVTSSSSVNSVNNNLGVKDYEQVFKDGSSEFRKIYKFKLSNDVNVEEAVKQYQDDSNVEYAEPNYLYYAEFIPNDLFFSQQWAHVNTNAIEAWDIEMGSADVVIAIVDTGVDYMHEDLRENMLGDCSGGCPEGTGFDLVDINISFYEENVPGFELIPEEDYTVPDNNPSDYHGHGTHVAGIAAASTNNGIGIAGACPNCNIMPVRAGFAFKTQDFIAGAFESDDIANAIIYAVDNGADIISMSYGGLFPAEISKEAYEYAYGQGVILIAAAGNGNSNGMHYPSDYDTTISVAATDNTDTRAGFSNYGFKVDIAAPGVDIISTFPSTNVFEIPEDYVRWGGTSMATPYVSGLAGLLLSRDPSLSQEEVLFIIQQTAQRVNSDVYIGAGLVNSKDAVLHLDYLKNSIGKVKIIWPGDGFIVNSPTLGVEGNAQEDYSLYYAEGIYPSQWDLVTTGSPTINQVLGTIDLQGSEGWHTVRLTSNNGQIPVSDEARFFVGSGLTIAVADDYFEGAAVYAVDRATDELVGYASLNPGRSTMLLLPPDVQSVDLVGWMARWITEPNWTNDFYDVKTNIAASTGDVIVFSSLGSTNNMNPQVLPDKDNNAIEETLQMLTFPFADTYSTYPLEDWFQITGEPTRGSLNLDEISAEENQLINILIELKNNRGNYEMVHFNSFQNYHKDITFLAYGIVGNEVYEIKKNLGNSITGDLVVPISSSDFTRLLYDFDIQGGLFYDVFPMFIDDLGDDRPYAYYPLEGVFGEERWKNLPSDNKIEFYTTSTPTEWYFKTSNIRLFRGEGEFPENPVLQTPYLKDASAGQVKFHYDFPPYEMSTSSTELQFGVPPLLWGSTLEIVDQYVMDFWNIYSWHNDYDGNVIKNAVLNVIFDNKLQCERNLFPLKNANFYWDQPDNLPPGWETDPCVDAIQKPVEFQLLYDYYYHGQTRDAIMKLQFDTRRNEFLPPIIKSFDIYGNNVRIDIDAVGGIIINAYIEAWTGNAWADIDETVIDSRVGKLIEATIASEFIVDGNARLKVVAVDDSNNLLEYVLDIPWAPGQEQVYYVGDVDEDGVITAIDAQLISRHVNGLSTQYPVRLNNSDVTLDGEITEEDAVRVAECAIGLATCNVRQEDYPVTTTCSDSDGGRDYGKRGTVTIQYPNGNIETYTDSCEIKSNLREYYCDGNNVALEVYSCLNRCDNGVCIGEGVILYVGDVTEDGVINVIDAQQIARYVQGLSTSYEIRLNNSDVNLDGAITIDDANRVAECTIGLAECNVKQEDY